jgi:hypothetical protein
LENSGFFLTHPLYSPSLTKLERGKIIKKFIEIPPSLFQREGGKGGELERKISVESAFSNT